MMQWYAKNPVWIPRAQSYTWCTGHMVIQVPLSGGMQVIIPATWQGIIVVLPQVSSLSLTVFLKFILTRFEGQRMQQQFDTVIWGSKERKIYQNTTHSLMLSQI